MAEWGFSVGAYAVNIVDVLILIIALLAAVTGVVRGFAMEFSSRIGFLVGFLVGLLFANLGANLIVDTFDLPPLWSTLIAFILFFIIGYVLIMFPILAADLSYARPIDGEEGWQILRRVTPSTNNFTLDKNEKVEKFATNDPLGIGMTLSAISVVFSVLVLLFLFFYWFAVGFRKVTAKPVKAEKIRTPVAVDEIPGEVIAAISAALYELDNDVHDIEDTIITIERTRRTYSPWSSKIYGLRKLPQ